MRSTLERLQREFDGALREAGRKAQAIEAVRIAVKYMTPVVLMTDGYLANGAEPWRIPDVSDIAPFPDAPPHILGRTQIGGALVALIDLGQLIGAPRDPNAVHDPDARALCLEVQGDDGVIHVGLRVDAVTGVGRLDGDEMTPLAAQGMLNWDSRMVEGVGHYQERAVTVLDVDGLLSTAVLAEAMEGGDDV